jgi:hypothetical protein
VAARAGGEATTCQTADDGKNSDVAAEENQRQESLDNCMCERLMLYRFTTYYWYACLHGIGGSCSTYRDHNEFTLKLQPTFSIETSSTC